MAGWLSWPSVILETNRPGATDATWDREVCCRSIKQKSVQGHCGLFQNTWTGQKNEVMDVMPTLDVVDGPYEEEDSAEDDEGVWGRLFPLRKEFVPLSEW